MPRGSPFRPESQTFALGERSSVSGGPKFGLKDGQFRLQFSNVKLPRRNMGAQDSFSVSVPGGSWNRRAAKASTLQGKRPIRADGWNICVNYDISSVRASDLAPRERTGVLSAASQGHVHV